MKLLNLKRVLCLSPHPDDVEYSMLGTIVKHQDTTFDVLCLSCGGAKGFDDTNKLNRREEVLNVWSSLKHNNYNNVTLSFAECDYLEDKTEPGWINYIENEFINKQKYDAIFIPPEKDSMYEHRFVNKFGSALIRKDAISLIEYHTVSTLNCWKPNVFIDIDEVYESKLSALNKFVSQIDKSYFTEDTLDSFHSNFQCRKRGVKVVEQFKILEMFGE